MKQAFTMIELIFVIVIIGILAAVAIPKLSATRDDAKNAAICQDLAICITDMEAHYTARQTTELTESNACIKPVIGNLISLSGNKQVLSVSNAPELCPSLNGNHTFGGVRISI